MFAINLRKTVFSAFAGALLLGLASTSRAVITFSNVTFNGTPNLIAGASFFSSTFDIDFVFPNAIVGDFQPTRQGVVTITYEATSTEAINAMTFSLLGGVSGSGLIQFSEVVEDMVTPGIIATAGPFSISSNSQLPFNTSFEFSRASTHIKVKKDFFLIAEPNTENLDLARISLVEQNLQTVPEPASMAAFGIGLAAIVARRRRK